MLPPDASLRSLVTTYARLRAVLGETLGQPELILPNGHYFPDAFAPDPAGIARLFARMVSHSPLADDLPVDLAFIQPDERAGGCGSSACGVSAGARAGGGAVEDLGDRYRVSVPASEASHPVLLTTALARAIGALVLHEDGQGSGAVTDATAEVCAAQCGFGVLLTGGAEVWAKSCGGLKGIRATALSVEESATVLALFTALHGVHAVERAEARRHLQPTQREAFEDACEWVDSNPFLLETLGRSPALLEHGTFDLEPQRGPLGRWLYRRRVERELRAPPAKPSFAPSAARQRYLAEARELVEGTFEEE